MTSNDFHDVLNKTLQEIKDNLPATLTDEEKNMQVDKAFTYIRLFIKNLKERS